MTLKYEIVEANPAIGQIKVRYFNEANPVGWSYAIDVPVLNGAYVTGHDLDVEIRQRAPVWQLQRAAEVNGLDFSEIAKLVLPVAEPVVGESSQKPNKAVGIPGEYTVPLNVYKENAKQKMLFLPEEYYPRIYYIKQQAAKEFNERYPHDNSYVIPSYLVMEAQIKAIAVAEVVEQILNKAANSAAMLTEIETKRMFANGEVNEAADESSVNQIVEAFTFEMKHILRIA